MITSTAAQVSETSLAIWDAINVIELNTGPTNHKILQQQWRCSSPESWSRPQLTKNMKTKLRMMRCSNLRLCFFEMRSP